MSLLERFWQQRKANPRFFGIHAEPTAEMNKLLPFVLFILMAVLYIGASEYRHSDNSHDKTLPTIGKMARSIGGMIIEYHGEGEWTWKVWTWDWDVRRWEPRFWRQFEVLELPLDTWASLRRIGIAMGMSSAAGFLLGMNMGLFPGMRLFMLGFTTFLGIVPTLAILPILFYVFDVDELGKIMLIFFGTFATIASSMYLSTRRISKEQITKALTLGCSQLQVVYRLVMPQTLPCLIDAMRLSLGAAWLFLIAAETTSASQGLGYRIFLVMRYFNMDISIPYVLWITFLGYTGDLILRRIIQWKFAWYLVSRD